MNIVEYLETRGHHLRRAGPYQMKTNCPLHADSDPSFYVYLADGHWYCYGCAQRGDFAGLVWRLEYGARPDAWREVFRKLCELGARQEEARLVPMPARRAADELERKVMTVALEHYREALRRKPAVARYLEGRGVRDPMGLPLGYVSGDPVDFVELAHKLQALGSGWRSAAVATGILRPSGTEALANRVVIAEVREREVVWLQSRTLDPTAKLRYLNPRELRKPLFGLETLSWSYPLVAIVEGAFDALPLHSVGVPAVATLGNKMSDFDAFVQMVGHRRVAVMTDADATGDTFAQTLLGDLAAARVSAFRLSPSPYKDPGRWAEVEGPEYIAATLCTTLAAA